MSSRREDLVPFAGLRALHPTAAACQLDAYFPEYTDGEWRLLALEASDAVEFANGYDPLDEPPVKRHQPTQRSTWATSTTPGELALASDDPLKQVEPRVYVEALTGDVVPPNGWLSCPLPDHEDQTPSFQVLSSHWRCFGCCRGGGIIDLGAALYGIEPRGEGYWRLRDRIFEALVWAPLPHEVDR
jgi:hypothetical protein